MRHLPPGLLTFALLLASSLCAAHAAAYDYYWTLASPQTGYYGDTANWVDASGNPGAVPSSTDNAILKRNGLAKIETSGVFGPSVANNLYLGSNSTDGPYPPGEGHMAITGGAMVCNLAYVGDAGATGSLSVSGTGQFTANFTTYVGTLGGTGALTLADGAVLTCSDASRVAVGSETAALGGHATVSMSGSSQWNVTGGSWCGVGVYSLADATWSMQGSSSYSCAGSLFVGDSGGTTELTLSGDASVNAGVDGWIGTRGGAATVNLSGTSSLTAASLWRFAVDAGGRADITMSQDASISGAAVYAGYGRDSLGHISGASVAMSGGNIHSDAGAYFGDAGGTATVTLSGDASIDATTALCFGTAALSEAHVTLSENASLAAGENFYLGWQGAGELTMSGNTSVTATGNSYIGDLGGSATVTMTGTTVVKPTITVNGASRLGTGAGTTATLLMTNARYYGNGGWMGGYGADSRVDIDLHGDSLISFTAWLNIGAEASLATVDLHNDAAIEAYNFDLGWGIGTDAPITLHDNSSLTSLGGDVYVGVQGGHASITLTGDGSPRVTAPLLAVGQQWLLAGQPGAYRSSGTMTVDATGAEVAVDTLRIGYAGGIGVYHQNAGTTTVATPVVVGDADDRIEVIEGVPVVIQVHGTGTLALKGGTLACPGITAGRTVDANPDATSSTIQFNGGTLQATAHNPDFIANPEDATLIVHVQAGGAVVDTNGFDVGLGVALDEDSASAGGGLTKRGAGTLRLAAAAHTYAGDTRVDEGTLATTNNTTLPDDAAVRIAVGAVMMLDFSGVAPDVIGELYLGGAAMTDEGTWGSTASGAAHQNDAYFAGLGMVLLEIQGPSIPGDTNDDGRVNAADAQALAANWGKAVPLGDVTKGDFNRDGWVGAADASILAANWTGAAESSATVPEPSAPAFLLAALAALAIRRRSRPSLQKSS